VCAARTLVPTFFFNKFWHKLAHSLSHDLQNLALLTISLQNLAMMTRPEHNNFT
jgi:hypothetical protein